MSSPHSESPGSLNSSAVTSNVTPKTAVLHDAVTKTDPPSTFISALEKHASSNPGNAYAFVPVLGSTGNDWVPVSYSAIASAVDCAAWWIHKTIGIGQNNETVAYLGPTDLRYTIFMIASIKVGYKVLLPSLRNSVEGQCHMLESTYCTKVLHAQEIISSIDPIRKTLPSLDTFQVPAAADLFAGGNVESYASQPSSADDDRCIVILHTSGSTGLPKPVFLTNGSIAAISRLDELPAPSGRVNIYKEFYLPGKAVFSMLPFFHMMGVLVTVRAVFHGAPFILPPPGKPVDADLFLEVLRCTKPWAGFAAPSLLEDISRREECSQILGNLDYVFYGGAPLAPAAGEILNNITRPVNNIGSTEIGPIPTLMLESREDFEYFEWMTGTGVLMEPFSDELCEMVIERNTDRSFQCLFHSFPEYKRWETKDLYEQHPTKPGLWRHAGRKDDIIVLSNGEKFAPVDFEKSVEGHPKIKGALIMGSGQFQASLLIEPDWSLVDSSAECLGRFVYDIWPLVKAANQKLPSHGQIWQSKIALSKPDVPFKRSPKGSIMRYATAKLYQAHIDTLYISERVERRLSGLRRQSIVDGSVDHGGYKEIIRHVFENLLPAFDEGTDRNTSIFTLGADSLQVLGIASALSHVLVPMSNGLAARVLPSAVYKHPSVNSLVEYIAEAHSRNSSPLHIELSRSDIIQLTLDKFMGRLPRQQTQVGLQTAILTGSTGSLGRYILHELINSPAIGKVYCLNRAQDAKKRHIKYHLEYKLETDFSKVEFLHADFSKHDFGLGDDDYSRLLLETDFIIHNSWEVNFNLPLSSFEATHLSGIRNLISFSLKNSAKAPIIFISSIASVGNWPKHHQSGVPEEIFYDHSLPLEQGYGESKYIAEQMLAHATIELGLNSTIIRLGQIAGTSAGPGLWNPREWLPSLVTTSLAMGFIPESLSIQNEVAWVPVDVTAKAIVEICLGHKGREKIEVFHIMNPHTVAWSTLLGSPREFAVAGSNHEIQSIPLKDWVGRLEALSDGSAQAEQYPAIKLLEFYQGWLETNESLPMLQVDNSLKVSEAMRNLGPINEAMMKLWLSQWRNASKHSENGKPSTLHDDQQIQVAEDSKVVPLFKDIEYDAPNGI